MILLDIKVFRKVLDKFRIIPSDKLSHIIAALSIPPRKNQAYLSEQEKKIILCLDYGYPQPKRRIDFYQVASHILLLHSTKICKAATP